MKKFFYSFDQATIVAHLVKWTLLVIPISLTVGSLVALFLWLLEKVTQIRWQHEWLLFLLPLAGIPIYFLYKYLGKNSDAGNNLILEEIHQPGGGVPARMTPLVLITTVVTHLFGGSAGREGTAVQMGGSVANLYARWFKLNEQDLRILLMTGVAAGFGAVFGTPVTGAVFALEVLAIGEMRYGALIPCLIAAVFADITTAAWGIHHTHYQIDFTGSAHDLIPFLHVDVLLIVKVILAGLCFGLASFLFAELMHTIKNYSNRIIHHSGMKWLIPVIGGLLIIALCYVTGTTNYTGLGVNGKNAGSVSIVAAFHAGGATSWSWLLKMLFTAITLGMGFKGGEVTPLFFIGATLGNTLAVLWGAPIDLFAGLGFIAVFAGATNTPIACTLMGVELFGGGNVLYFAIACFTAYYFSGHSGIYTAQRVRVGKITNDAQHKEKTLKQIREKRIAKRK